MPTVKPIEGTVIDSTHSLGSHMDFAFLFNEGKGISVGDSSGNGNTGTLLGNNGRTPRWEGTYLDFPGNHAQRVRINNSDTWNSGAGGDFTIVAHVRPQGPAALQDYVSRENSAATQSGDFRIARSTALTSLVVEDVSGHPSLLTGVPKLSFQTVIARQNSTEGSLWVNGIEGATKASTTPNIDDQNNGFDIGIGNLHGGETNSTSALVGHIEFVYIYSRALTDAEIIEISTSPYQMYNPFTTTPVGTRGTILHKAAPVGATKTQWEMTPQFNNDDPFTITSTNTGADSDSVLSSSIDFIEVWLPPDHVYLLRVRHLVGGNLTDYSLAVDVTMRGALNSFDKFHALSANTVTKANGVIEDITTGNVIIVDNKDNIDIIE